MYYIRVPECYDNFQLIRSIPGTPLLYKNDGEILVGGELITPREYAVMRERYINMPPLHRHYFCSVKKHNTYWSFGARFIVRDAPFVPSLSYEEYKAHCRLKGFKNPIDR